MNAFAAPIDRLRSGTSTWPAVAMGVFGLVVVSFLLRATALHGRYWIDEGLSVGIANHPLTAIPGLLREDGSPPLYYLLLGVWIRLIGDGEARTHLLSLAFALASVPLGFAAGRALFSERAGWFVAVIAALNPFLSYYAQETRMYSLVVTLSLATAATWCLTYVHGRRRWAWVFGVCGALMAYSHNWGLFLLAGTLVALIPIWRAGTLRVRDVLVGYGVLAVLYLPWVPTLLFQAQHTGAPWAESPSIRAVPGMLARLAGGPGPAVAILLVGGSGLIAYLRARSPLAGRRTRETTVVTSLGLMLITALVLAFIGAQLTPAWTTRYFAALIGPLILLSGAVLARAGTMGLATTALLAGLWLHPPTKAVNNKSNVHHVSLLLRGRVAPGDVVVSTHPEQVPVEHFYFPHGLRWASGMGWFRDTGVMDWRDALERYKHARPTPTSHRFISVLRPGQQLVLVQPILRTAHWGAPWTELVRRRAIQWERVLDRNPELRRERAIPHLGNTKLPHGIRVVLYRKL